ncbi:MAG: urease accessory protein [Spirosomataceae bacterium]
MTETLLIACSIGFAHAFEADHLVAVSSIVTKRNNTILAIKDGIFWGMGHTSIILLVGIIYMIGRFVLDENDFRYFEASVGLMLIFLGGTRLYKFYKNPEIQHQHNPDGSHKMAYGIGTVHGLAGSGAVLLTVLGQIKGEFNGILYILVFGLGSVIGMMIAAGVFSIPFSAKFFKIKWLSYSLTLISCLLCIGLGVLIFYKNLSN